MSKDLSTSREFAVNSILNLYDEKFVLFEGTSDVNLWKNSKVIRQEYKLIEVDNPHLDAYHVILDKPPKLRNNKKEIKDLIFKNKNHRKIYGVLDKDIEGLPESRYSLTNHELIKYVDDYDLEMTLLKVIMNKEQYFFNFINEYIFKIRNWNSKSFENIIFSLLLVNALLIRLKLNKLNYSSSDIIRDLRNNIELIRSLLKQTINFPINQNTKKEFIFDETLRGFKEYIIKTTEIATENEINSIEWNSFKNKILFDLNTPKYESIYKYVNGHLFFITLSELVKIHHEKCPDEVNGSYIERKFRNYDFFIQKFLPLTQIYQTLGAL
jgi:hypothetical protein